MKRFFALFLAISLLCGLCACGKTDSESTPAPEFTPQPMAEALEPTEAGRGSFTVSELWEGITEPYSAATGVDISVAEAGEATLVIADEEALRTGSGWVDLSESAAYALLQEKDYALCASDGSVIALPLSLDSVAVGVNLELLEQAGYSMEALDGFKALRRFSTSVNDRKDTLGFSAWAPMALDEGSAEKLTRYLFDMPLYAELNEGGSFTGKYVGDYKDSHYKDLFTVMLDYGTKTTDAVNVVDTNEALDAFVQGQCLFCLLGSWEMDTLAEKGFDLSKLDFVPAWMGMPGEENWGFITDTTLYVAIHKGESDSVNAAEDFLYWALTDEDSRSTLSELYVGLPYEGCACDNPLLRKNAENDAAGLSAVPWLHRQLSDPEGWDSYMTKELHAITPDNMVWRWQIMTWELVKLWNGN